MVFGGPVMRAVNYLADDDRRPIPAASTARMDDNQEKIATASAIGGFCNVPVPFAWRPATDSAHPRPTGYDVCGLV